MSGGYPAKQRRCARLLGLIEARRLLSDAQAALTEAIQGSHDPESITEARRQFTEARERVRVLRG